VAFPAGLMGNGRQKTNSPSGIELPSRPKIPSEPNSYSTNKSAPTYLPKWLSKADSDLEAFKSVHIQTPSEQLPKQKPKTQPLETRESTIRTEIYSDRLLDYFKLGRYGKAPKPPADYQPDWLVDAEGHTALHWASAMGDIKIIRQLKTFGANLACQNMRGETPLMRAVRFPHSYNNRTMPAIVQELIMTIGAVDFLQGTALHHAVASLQKDSFLDRVAKFYINAIVQGTWEHFGSEYVQRILDAQDMDENTALHIAAKEMAKECVTELQNLGAAPDTRNNDGFTPSGVKDEDELGTNAIDIPTSRRPYYPHARRSSSVAQQHRSLAVDEDDLPFGIHRSISLGADDREPPSWLEQTTENVASPSSPSPCSLLQPAPHISESLYFRRQVVKNVLEDEDGYEYEEGNGDVDGDDWEDYDGDENES
jgi:hypothetical protein